MREEEEEGSDRGGGGGSEERSGKLSDAYLVINFIIKSRFLHYVTP